MTEEQHVATGTRAQTGSFWSRLKRNPWFWSALFGVVFLTAIRPLTRHVPDPPPVLSTLPAFELIDQSGETFGTRDLHGHVYVASFFFTTCKSICPALMRAISELQRRYDRIDASIRIVSITVDPESDSPQVLKDYASKMGIDTERWSLLTGDRESIKRLLIDGFRADMGEKEQVSPNLVDIAHSSKVVLVDKNGNIRGYYGTDPHGLDEAFHRSLHVAAEDE